MIKISNLNISFNDELIYKNFELTLKKGDKCAIIGKSGTGKSTLLNLLVGFIPNFSGQVLVDGINLNTSSVSGIRKITAWVPQEMAFNYSSVNELLLAPFNFELNRNNTPSSKEISKIFNAFELSETILNKKVQEISGGQKQRIIIASAILLNKPLLLLDEPTSALDEGIKKKVADYILSKKDITVIASTHDEYWINNSEKVIKL